MSVRFLQSTTPQENQTIRVNDVIARGAITCTEGISTSSSISLDGSLSFDGTALTGGQITLPPLTNFPQATANNANVAASIGGVAPEQFMVTTFESSPGVGGDIAAGASVTFNIFHSGVVAGKTLVLMSKAGSFNGLYEVTDYVSATSNGNIFVTRHNHGATTASGNQQLIFKLIQTV
jgi:hypothetical protein